MTSEQLLASARFIVDGDGNKKAVVLDYEVWKQILAWIEMTDEEPEAETAAWDEAFADSQDILSMLADEALSEHQAGNTKPLDELL